MKIKHKLTLLRIINTLLTGKFWGVLIENITLICLALFTLLCIGALSSAVLAKLGYVNTPDTMTMKHTFICLGLGATSLIGIVIMIFALFGVLILLDEFKYWVEGKESKLQEIQNEQFETNLKGGDE